MAASLIVRISRFPGEHFAQLSVSSNTGHTSPNNGFEQTSQVNEVDVRFWSIASFERMRMLRSQLMMYDCDAANQRFGPNSDMALESR